MTFLSRNYTRERMSSFLLQWLSRGAARVSGVCIALFSSATDARERFPCEEQWPAFEMQITTAAAMLRKAKPQDRVCWYLTARMHKNEENKTCRSNKYQY